MSNTRKTQTPAGRRPVRIVCAGHVGVIRGGQPGQEATGQYLKRYDPEAHDGQGEVIWTSDPGQAATFADIIAAHACWTQVPRSRPVRGDGRPNRPMTAFSITFETAADFN